MGKKTRAQTPGNGPATPPPDTPTAPTPPSPDAGTTPRADGPSGAVWDALTATPRSAVTAIATAAGVPVAHARKMLVAWEKAGHATRTPGGHHGGKRAPDTWQATTPTTTDPHTQAPDPTPNEGTNTTPPDTATTSPSTDTSHPEPTAHEPTSPESSPGERTDDATDTDVPDGDGGMDEAAVAQARDALTTLRNAITEAMNALEGGDRAAALTAADTIYADSGSTRRLVRTAAHPRTRGTSGQVRSHPGELRTKVAAHLAAHPGKDFTPHEIGKVIGHSAGAIANALDRLISLGEAAATCDRPRRFTTTATVATVAAVSAADTNRATATAAAS